MDEHGRVYYYNLTLGLTQWLKPRMFHLQELVFKNPKNWTVELDDKRNRYWVNRQAGVVQWDVPSCVVQYVLHSPTSPLNRPRKARKQNTANPGKTAKFEENDSSDSDPMDPPEADFADDTIPMSPEDYDRQLMRTQAAEVRAKLEANLLQGLMQNSDDFPDLTYPSFHLETVVSHEKKSEGKQGLTMTNPDGIAVEFDDDELDHKQKNVPILDLAVHRKGNMANEVLGIGETLTTDELLSFSSRQLTKALLARNEIYSVEAVQLFKNILSYMGDRESSKKIGFKHAQKIITGLLKSAQSQQDECYLQLYKQTNKNPRIKSERKGWNLLNLCLVSFPPSAVLQRLVMDHCNDALKHSTDDEVKQSAQACLSKMDIIFEVGKRFQTPSEAEITAIEANRGLEVSVLFPDGDVVFYQVDSFCTIRSLERFICQHRGIKLSQAFCLMEGTVQTFVRPEDYTGFSLFQKLDPSARVVDVMGRWENKDLSEAVELDDESVNIKKKRIGKRAKELEEQLSTGKEELMERKNPVSYSRFVFRAHVVLPPTNAHLHEDPIASHFMYLQTLSDVLTYEWPLKEAECDVLPLILALKLQVDHGNLNMRKHGRSWIQLNIHKILAPSVQDTLLLDMDDNYAALVEDNWSELMHMSKGACARRFWEHASSFEFFGGIKFLCLQSDDHTWPSEVLVTLTHDFFIVGKVDVPDCILGKWSWSQVITWGDAPTKAIFVLGTLAKQKTLNLLTKYASIISQLAKVHVELQLRGKIEL